MAVRSGLFLSDDGPESSFLGTKKPQNTLIFCGLVLFRLLLAGIENRCNLIAAICPTRKVELEGLVPCAPNAVISISYIRSISLCNEYVTNLSFFFRRLSRRDHKCGLQMQIYSNSVTFASVRVRFKHC